MRDQLVCHACVSHLSYLLFVSDFFFTKGSRVLFFSGLVLGSNKYMHFVDGQCMPRWLSLALIVFVVVFKQLKLLDERYRPWC